MKLEYYPVEKLKEDILKILGKYLISHNIKFS